MLDPQHRRGGERDQDAQAASEHNPGWRNQAGQKTELGRSAPPSTAEKVEPGTMRGVGKSHGDVRNVFLTTRAAQSCKGAQGDGVSITEILKN